MNILVVEDHARDRKLLRLNIEEHGHRAIEAENGVEALNILSREQPDLIISDALMPLLDGFGLLRALKQDKRLAVIPFVFYSAVYTGAQDKALALALGADAFVAKPLEPELLWQRIRDVVADRKAKVDGQSDRPLPDEEFYRNYSQVVATKLEEKVHELEEELEKRTQLEAERADMTRALQQSRDEWEATFNSIPLVVTIHDRDLRIIRANEATCRMLGQPREEILGRLCYEALFGQTEPCPSCPAQIAFNEARTHQQEMEPDRSGKLFLVSATPFCNEKGEIDRIIHIVQDVTDLRETEARYRHAQKMEAIGTLAGGIAHDFNNILFAIIGYAEFIQRDVPPDSKTGRNVAMILEAGRRATELVKQILTFSRRTETKKQPLRLQLLIKETLKMLRATLPATVTILEDIDSDCGTVLADPTNMHQVLINLCTNAYQALPDEKGTLRIALHQRHVDTADIPVREDVEPGEFVVFSVSDTGCGMDRDTLEHIFEPYFTTKGPGEGTGLGLAVIHGIVQGCRGFVQVESEVGRGTTFSVFLPVTMEAGSQPVARRQKSAAVPVGKGQGILVVDDEPLLVEVNRTRLEQQGYRVTGFTDSKEALETFRSRPDAFELLITDQTMPGLTGEELAKAVLKINPSLPIILCTGHSEIVSEGKALRQGITQYVYKPLSRDELLNAVHAALEGNHG